MADEFAPVTPGEMLKEEFLAEYGSPKVSSLWRLGFHRID